MPAPDLYRRLQQHLDRMPVGLPATRSGVEIRILKRLFTPEEARIALALSALPEPVHVIARRTRRFLAPDALRLALADMAARGLIERVPHRRGVRYGKALLAIGMYERQLPRLDAELERDVRAYADEAFGAELHRTRIPQMRTVPVHASIPLSRGVMPSDDLRAFVKQSSGPFAVMDCICRHGKDLVGDPCRQTKVRATCLTFEAAANSMVEGGAARYITREQVMELLDVADREGLVLQPQNTAAPLFVCCCCGCCCHVLQTARHLPEPARAFSTNYRAVVDEARCEACGTCLSRCQMDAVRLEGEFARVNEARCIGCGLCVTTCPSAAMELSRTAEERIPPRDTPTLYTRIFLERFGKFAATIALARHAVGMKI